MLGSYSLATALVIYLTSVLAQAADDTRTVYRAVDEHGVVTFSDQAMPDAQTIELSVSSPSPESLDETTRRFESELEWLAYLDDSRRAQADQDHQAQLNELELARARAELERAKAPEPEPYRYHTYPYGFWPGHRPRPPHPVPDAPSPRPPFSPPPFAPPPFGHNASAPPPEEPSPVTSSPLPIEN